jgi:hypothetical protein
MANAASDEGSAPFLRSDMSVCQTNGPAEEKLYKYKEYLEQALRSEIHAKSGFGHSGVIGLNFRGSYDPVSPPASQQPTSMTNVIRLNRMPFSINVPLDENQESKRLHLVSNITCISCSYTRMHANTYIIHTGGYSHGRINVRRCTSFCRYVGHIHF